MPIFAKLEICKDATPRSAAVNMAIDEALLETAKIPSIRFYRWNSPALSFGYFGKFADVADYAAERDLVRRWTGGGIVFHGDDLTYSIIIPAASEFSSASSKSIYAVIQAALCQGVVERAQRKIAERINRGTSERDCGAEIWQQPLAQAALNRCSHAPVRVQQRPAGRWLQSIRKLETCAHRTCCFDNTRAAPL